MSPSPPVPLSAIDPMPPLNGVEFFVAPSGNDCNPGSQDLPFASVQKARDAIRASGKAGKVPIKVSLAKGTYVLSEALVFTPEDSGSKSAPITYQAANGGEAIFSGGIPLQLVWKPYRDNIWQAKAPADLELDQLFANGVRQHMARYPNLDESKKSEPYNGYASSAISDERVASWADPTGGYIHAMHEAQWGGYHYHIIGKKNDGSLAYEGGWQNNRKGHMHPEYRMVENIFEELDAPGEWFHNRKTKTLYFYPPSGSDPNQTDFMGVHLTTLIEFRGEAYKPVRFITLQDLIFRHTARTFMDNKEPLLRSDWTIHRAGAVFFSDAEDCSILDSTFDQVGANAVFVSNYNRRLRFKGLHIEGAGASGFVFAGAPTAVRNPLFEYGECQDLSKIDHTPGPKTNHYPANCLIDNCLIHRIGLVEKQSAGVSISMSQDITVRHCSIYDTSRAGINIGDGTWGGHVIEFCDVFDTVLETSDHGSFNSWGRDRYWVHAHRAVTQPEVQKHPQLPFLDAVKPTVIRNSRWRCDHGWDIDLDDGSSHYEIYNNLMLAGGLKLREGYGRIVYNNIIVNNGLHPHVWFDDSGDLFYSNIVMSRHAPIGMPSKWGTQIDRNFFNSTNADRTAFIDQGCDRLSLAGDAQFVDPTHGDFTVKPGSPATAIGFVNFPMDYFGVQSPALKAIARTPEIPCLVCLKNDGTSRRTGSWLGIELREIIGEEFSAFGVSRESGGIHLPKVTAFTTAAKIGFHDNDLIQGVNGHIVTSIAELRAAVQDATSQPLSITYVRNQKKRTVKIPLIYQDLDDITTT